MTDTKPAYQVLARKYRPETFADLVGQDAMVRTLKNAFAADRIAQAFIMTGIRGTGKTTTARIIAKGMNCIGRDGQGGPTTEPCGVCEHCVAIAEGRHVDVMEMDAASRTGVGDIREIIESVHYRAASARYKIYIIDEVHMLSTSAFNALLKTLEEPPPHAKFIFATTEIRKVPVTVLSRCQRFDLRRIEPGGDDRPAAPDRRGRGCDDHRRRAGADHPRRRRVGPRRDQPAGPVDQSWRGRDHRRPGACDAGPGRPRPRNRPVRDGDARRRRIGADRVAVAICRWRRSGRGAARHGRDRALDLRRQDHTGRAGGSDDLSGRTVAGQGPGRPAADAGHVTDVAAAAEGAGGGVRRAQRDDGRRDGDHPPDPCRRPARPRGPDPPRPAGTDGRRVRARTFGGGRARGPSPTGDAPRPPGAGGPGARFRGACWP